MQDIFRVGITNITANREDYLAAKQIVQRREGVVASTPNKMFHLITLHPNTFPKMSLGVWI